MKKHNPILSIIFPVRNEEANIEIAIKFLNALIEIPFEILIIYDSPKDNSIPVIRRLTRKYSNLYGIRNTSEPGVTNAILTGIKISKGKYILIAPIDEIAPIVCIKDMIYLLKHGCDLVSGTRYAYGGKRLGGSIIGKTLSFTANKLFRLFSRSGITDATTGYKMFKREVMQKINLKSKKGGWAFTLEFTTKALLAETKIGEVPIVSIDRLYGGTSSFSLGPWLNEYTKWFLWGIMKLNLNRKKGKKVYVRIPSVITY